MGCFLSLFQGRFLSSRHSTVGHRLEKYLLESFPSLLGLIWTLLLCHRYSHESTFLHFLLRHRRKNLNQPSKNIKPVTSFVKIKPITNQKWRQTSVTGIVLVKDYHRSLQNFDHYYRGYSNILISSFLEIDFEINISDKKSRPFDLSEVIFKCIKVL